MHFNDSIYAFAHDTIKHKLMKKHLMILFLLCYISINSQTVQKDLYTFDFSINDRPINENARLLKDMGYKGIVLNVNSDTQLDKLNNYLATEEFQSGALTIPVIYYVWNGDNAAEKGDNPRWKSIMNSIPESTSFWLLENSSSPTRGKIIQALKEMTNEAKKLNKDVVIYPHDHHFIDNAEDAVSYIKEVNADNLFTTVHLCHELREGNIDRMSEVIENTKEYLKYVSISGAFNVDTNAPQGPWEDVIRPLDDSAGYDLENYVRYLRESGYTGEVVLHTFGITRQAEDHMTSSLTVWENLVDKVNNETLSVNEQQITETNLYPNPVKRYLTITNKNSVGKTVTIYDVTGAAKITKALIKGENTIDVRALVAGLYLAKISSLDNRTQSAIKIIKTK